jgi:putative DNA methylase
LEEQIVYDRRFVEETFPVKAISHESAKEKSVRHGHISTLHVWWARRPLASSRATNYSALVEATISSAEKEEKRKFVSILSKWENSLNSDLVARARNDIRISNKGKVARVLDPFAGGGAIPLESQRLGCETYASDYNPVAVLILKCTIEYPRKFGVKDPRTNVGESKLISDVKKWGLWIIEQAEVEIGNLYPKESDGSNPVGYLWARTIPCQNPTCGAEIPLVRHFWLAKKSGRKIALFPVIKGKQVNFKVVGTGYEKMPSKFDPGAGTISAAVAVCLVCHSSVDDKSLRKLYVEKKSKTRIIAVVSHDDLNQRKNYRVAERKDVLSFEQAEALLARKEDALQESWGMPAVPDEFIHTPNNQEYKPGGLLYNFTPVLLYGMTKWGDLFNSRQKLALITFADKVRQAHQKMIDEGIDPEYARAVTSYLAISLDRLADKSATLVVYNVVGEKIEHVFGRQALGMISDYAEVNPFTGVGWPNMQDWILRVMEHCVRTALLDPSLPVPVVTQSSATSLKYPDNFFDGVFTDPPYYDNVPYSDLSDFFYVWLKRSVGHLYPELFSTPLTPKSDEAIAELPLLRGMGKSSAAEILPTIKTREHFENSMRTSFREINRVLKPGGISVIVYAHKSTAGWETLVDSLLDSGLVVTGSWPIHTEMKSRLRAKESAALASSIYMIARKTQRLPTGFYREVKIELDKHLRGKLDSLWKEGISGADFFISAIGSAVQVFGVYDSVIDDEGRVVRADRLLEDVRRIVADYAVRQVLHNGFAAEITPMARFYVLWRWAYGDAKLDFDDARKLASGVGIDLALEWNKSFIRKDKEFIEVLGPEERSQGLEESKELIDVLHHVLVLWKQSKSEEMIKLLNETGYGKSDVFYRVAQAISDSPLMDGTKEKKLLDGFLPSRQRITDDMRKETGQTRLFE